ncbi:DUF726 domain-containing protein [Haloarchaeobius sp. HRN-SO-5]|uniref:DUF726 domain-containing protein n=1 Tax=Haloarchaeobius sp. HRN-SO-5 TaxID=3446118 RepID=UPI003EB6B21B
MSHGHGNSEHEAQYVSRRRFVGGAATAALGTGLAAGATGTAAASDQFPRVTTRGHYDITWYGSVYLTDGHTEWDYDTVGTIPGVHTAAPDELLIHVHGWQNEPNEAVEGFIEAETAYRNNDYDGAVIGFSWDSDSSLFGWWDSTEIAEENGKKLANFVNQYRLANPDTTIRLVCHSLGARVTLRCVEVLNVNGITDALDSVALLGGAADNDAVSTGGRYGPDLASAVGQVDNYWKDGDDVLHWAYTTAEFDSAVGEEGCEGTPPWNYQDHNVDYVPDHFSYYQPDEGCIPEVVSEW